MLNLALRVVSHDAAGLLLAAVVAALGMTARAAGSAAPLWLALFALAAVMASMALFHWVQVLRAQKAHPAPGRLVDVGGYRLHVLAEGEAREGSPAVVWFGGAHSSGASMAHLHRELRVGARSILIDRAGTGFSDAGPYPRTTMLEAQECWRALQAAGEPGPFVLVGHSFGGFLAACMARKCPQRMAALVLLDATPPDTIIFGPRFGALRAMRRGAYVGGLLRLFGIHQSPLERAQRRQAPQIFELIDRLAGEAGRAERALAIRSRTPFAMASIFGELSPAGMATCAYDTATYDGDLGDLPVLLVAPGDARDADAAPEVGNAKGPERERVRRVLARSRERYLAISSNARRVVTPPGTEHVFPLQVPEFVVEVVREQVRACTPAAR